MKVASFVLTARSYALWMGLPTPFEQLYSMYICETKLEPGIVCLPIKYTYQVKMITPSSLILAMLLCQQGESW